MHLYRSGSFSNYKLYKCLIMNLGAVSPFTEMTVRKSPRQPTRACKIIENELESVQLHSALF